MATVLTPIIFISHGSPLMSFKDSDSAKAWTMLGQKALQQKIKGVVFIGAHWEVLDNCIRVATKPNPKNSRWTCVQKSELANRVIRSLENGGFNNVEEDPMFDWHDDTLIPSLWMFPGKTPPATVVSLNARYDSAFHLRIGKALSALRQEGILIICSGGAVHNLYRNNWWRFIIGRFDNFQEGSKPATWATEFAQTVGDIIANNSGVDLAGALTRLTESYRYKDAHPTDDHYYPLLVAAGLVADSGEQGKHLARTWELTNMCNDQFTWGEWSHPVEATVA